ncbi:DNA-methyltransferase [Mediterraneibacter hominis]|uniref:DNA-methyltransferase n=1 Tax=Mediterraneibacter hominis TaxID=2763054 RepID=UPI002ED3CA0A
MVSQTKRNKWDTVIPFNDYVILGNKIYYEKDIISLLKCFNQAGEYTLEYVLDWFYKNKKAGLWTEYKRIIKSNGVIVLFANGMFTSDLMQSNRKLWRYNLIWEKSQPTGFLNAKRMPLRAHEDICIFYKTPPTYNPQKTTGHVRKISKAEHKVGCKETTDYGTHGLTTYDSTERYPRSVLKFPKDSQKCAIHSTQKPVALIEWLIKTYTNPGEIVLDSCAGSMTLAIASMNTGRKYICIEKDPDIFEIGKKRVDSYRKMKCCVEKK